MVPPILLATIGGFVILHAVIFFFLPGLTRSDVCFAVTVAPGFHDCPDGRAILRKYRIELTILSALSLVAAVAGVWRLGAWFVPAGFVTMFAASYAGFYRARRRVLPYAAAPTAIREADLHRNDRTVPGSRLLASGPFLLVAGSAAFLWTHGNEFRAVVYFLSTLGILAAYTLLRYGMSHWSRSVYVCEPRIARELQFRRINSVIFLAAEYVIALHSSLIALIPYRPHGTAGPNGGFLVALFPMYLILVAAAVLVLARVGQGGSRLAAVSETPAGNAVPVGDRTEDCRWKFGIFYYNPDDAAVIVERRFGLGYTVNFARLATWIIMAFLLMGPLTPVLASRLYH